MSKAVVRNGDREGISHFFSIKTTLIFLVTSHMVGTDAHFHRRPATKAVDMTRVRAASSQRREMSVSSACSGKSPDGFRLSAPLQASNVGEVPGQF